MRPIPPSRTHTHCMEKYIAAVINYLPVSDLLNLLGRFENCAFVRNISIQTVALMLLYICNCLCYFTQFFHRNLFLGNFPTKTLELIVVPELFALLFSHIFISFHLRND